MFEWQFLKFFHTNNKELEITEIKKATYVFVPEIRASQFLKLNSKFFVDLLYGISDLWNLFIIY